MFAVPIAAKIGQDEREMDSAAEIARFRTLLEQKRQALLQEGDVKIESDLRPGGEGKVDDDAAPLSEMNQVIASTRNRERARQLHEIDEALARLNEDPDEYGLCEDCEEDIPTRRLELMPWTTLCIACQSKREDGSRGGSRKNLRDFR